MCLSTLVTEENRESSAPESLRLRRACARQNNGSRKMAMSYSLKFETVSLHSKRNFTGEIKVKVLKGLSWITRVGCMCLKGLHEGEAGGSGPEEMWPRSRDQGDSREEPQAKKCK